MVVLYNVQFSSAKGIEKKVRYNWKTTVSFSWAVTLVGLKIKLFASPTMTLIWAADATSAEARTKVVAKIILGERKGKRWFKEVV